MLPHISSACPPDFSDVGFPPRLEAMWARGRGKIRMMTETREKEKGIGIGGGEVTTVEDVLIILHTIVIYDRWPRIPAKPGRSTPGFRRTRLPWERVGNRGRWCTFFGLRVPFFLVCISFRFWFTLFLPLDLYNISAGFSTFYTS